VEIVEVEEGGVGEEVVGGEGEVVMGGRGEGVDMISLITFSRARIAAVRCCSRGGAMVITNRNSGSRILWRREGGEGIDDDPEGGGEERRDKGVSLRR
jgi:hypothetical protein